ncbi:MAG TPA: GH32 C-terminal domain-containing protein [Candidatus Parabacteroides faecavium]|nr:GH32 C-terminal domain-containing protein [Candidatus Parabacteroides faecavium]
MSTFIFKKGFACTGLLLALASCQNNPQAKITVVEQNDTLTVLEIANPTPYILLPIEESAPEAKVCLSTGDPGDTEMDIRLAQNQVDYLIPFALPTDDDKATLRIRMAPKDNICWQKMELTHTVDSTNVDPFRPVYHHTPLYGWMNDANGLVYKDGEYHLFYQYNPYGSMWGNMHWGHSVSQDLIHWEPFPIALERDTLGQIFSGSSVVDKDNTAGFGPGAIIAFYTSASDKNGQIQCMAYSTDNARTFTKYEKNPILTPFDGLRDFRDPKVFWYEPQKKWVMIVSADKEMRFYSSTNLKDWTYMSAFGAGYGVQPNQFECPDMVELPVDGDENNKKWALLVNINPGCLFGGSATEYFVGDFDGNKFTCDTKPEVAKWLDWGKDHYATVCFSNTGDRVIAVPWMSNWQYANIVPTSQFRSANALPRELSMFTEGNDIYIAANPVKEVENIRQEAQQLPDFEVKDTYAIDTLLADNQGAYEMCFTLQPNTANISGFKLKNSKGEEVNIYLDQKASKVVMDRTQSGIVEFGEQSTMHQKETENLAAKNAINYIDNFALATWAPTKKSSNHQFRIFVDKCSVELFVDGGKIAMTNLVFPNEPYNSVEFYNDKGSSTIKDMHIYELKL